MSYNVAEYVVGWLFDGLQNMVDLSQIVFLWFLMDTTHTHARKVKQIKVKLYITSVKSAPEGDGVFSGACWR